MTFHEKTIFIIKQIPYGKVSTYGRIALAAGNPGGARQVARTLHSSSKTKNLPWHRVINKSGMISLKPGYGYELQKKMLENEGIVFDNNDRIYLNIHLWSNFSLHYNSE